MVKLAELRIHELSRRRFCRDDWMGVFLKLGESPKMIIKARRRIGISQIMNKSRTVKARENSED